MGKRYAMWASLATCLLGPAVARAQQVSTEGQSVRKTAADSLPGSPTNPGVDLSPEAPPTPPAPGGRAPSFGAPTDRDAWAFTWGGRISGFEQIGIGRTAPGTPNQGTTLHTPALTLGKAPFYAGSAGTLNFQYANQTVRAFTSFDAGLTGSQWNGFYNSPNGPRLRSAYLLITPAPIGDVRLKLQLGAFPVSYGAPGPWGWGLFGPAMSIHGYGGTVRADIELGPRSQLYLEYGLAAVPAVDEAFVRGTFADWPENGLSTIANHAHVGLTLDNKRFAKLHLAQFDGRDMRTWLDGAMQPTPQGGQFSNAALYNPNSASATPQDGRIRAAALELRTTTEAWGELGVTAMYWGFDKALSVASGMSWGLDWTAGGREMTRKFLGPLSNGTGKIVALSAEYFFSLERILRYPEVFDGNGRDLKIDLAFLPFWTAKSEDRNYDNTKGYFLGATFEYVAFSWVSAVFMVFGENRNLAMLDVGAQWHNGTWSTYSGTVGLVLHSDWQAPERIVLGYSRYFYSNFADSNPAQPLDRDVFTLGASVAF